MYPNCYKSTAALLAGAGCALTVINLLQFCLQVQDVLNCYKSTATLLAGAGCALTVINLLQFCWQAQDVPQLFGSCCGLAAAVLLSCLAGHHISNIYMPAPLLRLSTTVARQIIQNKFTLLENIEWTFQ